MSRSRGQYQAALPYFDEALRREPDHAIAYSNRGYVCFQLGDARGALEDLEHAIQLDPEWTEAYRYRGQVRTAGGDAVGGARRLAQALARYQADGDQANAAETLDDLSRLP